MQTPQFFLNRRDGSIVAAFVDNEAKRAQQQGQGQGDLVHLPFGRPRHVQSGEDYVSLDPTAAAAVRSRSEPRRKKSGTLAWYSSISNQREKALVRLYIAQTNIHTDAWRTVHYCYTA